MSGNGFATPEKKNYAQLVGPGINAKVMYIFAGCKLH